MSNKLKLYVIMIITLGSAFFVYSITTNVVNDMKSVIIFAVLSVIAESLLIPTPGESAVSVGFAIGLSAILVLGVPEAAWIASVGIMLRTVQLNGNRYFVLNYPFYKTLFNGANIMLSAGIAGLCYKLLGGTSGVVDSNSFLIPMIVCILSYSLINETIMSGLMAIATGEGFFHSWFSNVLWAARDCVYVAPLGVLMAITYMKYSILGIFLFVGPLLLARYSYKLYVDMRRVYFDTVKSLSQAVEVKDPYTQGHSMRVSDYAYALGKRMKLPPKRLENLRMAAILHDIGKIGIDESILNKPERLTPEEFDKVKQHPENGVKIIQDIAFLKASSDIIIDHHEKVNGTGYPTGKTGAQISTEAGILAISDVYDALTSERPYRHALTVQQALDIIEEGKGEHFDPKLAAEFICMIKEQRSDIN